jgi:hypothetical protein
MKYDISFTILARELKAAALFASTDECRYIMNGVCVEVWPDGRVLLIGTDGRTLAFVKATLRVADIEGLPELPSGECVKLIIPSKMIADVRGNGCRAIYMRFTCDGATVPDVSMREEFSDITKTAKAVDGTYPNVRAVVQQPQEKGVRSVFLAPKLLSKFAKAIDMLAGGKNDGMIISPSGTELDSAIITSDSSSCFYGVLMPLRNNSIDLSICPPRPAWV